MDNVTHSLAGILIAEAVCAPRRPSEKGARFRTAALWTSALANNLPDLDFVYRGITPGKLGYLLHHRGHTHTIFGALALGALCLLGVTAVARARGVRFDAKELRTLAALAAFGSLLHLLFDFQNNYGVHPFWPFDARWFYGDTLFIVEPLLLCVAIPVIALLARTRGAATGVVMLLLGAMAYGAWMRVVPPAQVVGLLVVAASVAAAARALPRAGKVWLGIGGWLAVTGCFVVAGLATASAASASMSERYPDTRVVDMVRTPLPGNPLCWSAITIGVEGNRYVVRRGFVSLIPALIPPRRCASLDSRSSTAPLTAIEAIDRGVLWRSEYSGALPELRSLEGRCDVAAFLRYARAPFWVPGNPLVVGDLRFDRSRALEFTEMEASAGGHCPPNVPPWVPPRADVLGIH